MEEQNIYVTKLSHLSALISTSYRKGREDHRQTLEGVQLPFPVPIVEFTFLPCDRMAKWSEYLHDLRYVLGSSPGPIMGFFFTCDINPPMIQPGLKPRTLSGCVCTLTTSAVGNMLDYRWMQIHGPRVRSRFGPILSWRLIMK